MAPKKTIEIGAPESYINRELSWLSFALRVLALAEDPDTPLLERIKFAGIMGMLYDEFAMKRIGGLRRRIEKKNKRISSDGHTPEEELELCRKELHRQSVRICRLVEDELRPALVKAGIPILNYDQLNDIDRSRMRQYFRDSVEPILTPLAVDAGHPFPFISNLGINLAICIKDSGHKKSRFVRIKVPPNRPRWVEVPRRGFVPLEQVIAANLDLLFPATKKIECYVFRLTRGAKDDPWERIPLTEEEEPDLLPGSIIGMVTKELTARKFAGVVRIQVSANMPKDIQHWLIEQLNADPDDIEVWHSIMGLNDLVTYQPEGHPELRDPPHKPVTHPRLKKMDTHDTAAFFDEIRRGNILLHHPYHNFDTSVLRFLQSAARDPKVLAIKLTIYRTSSQSSIIQTMIEAARRGKQVAVLVEITARFDEAPNIAWGETLEKAGAHVIYGMERLKTHVKLGMVVREEGDGIRRYVHVATGNYHSGTARLYEDLGILSCDPELSEDVAAVFNELTGSIQVPDYGHLLVAPHNMRERFTELIQREAKHARAGRPCGIKTKMNQLQDPLIIQELYKASHAGVPISLNIRGLCCLRAGVPGLSDSITVFSILDRFLEHSRIYRFENDGKPEYFIGSADWMRRNLDSRMETIMSVTDPVIKDELENILSVYENDNITAWYMQPDGSYVRKTPPENEEPRPSQEIFIRLTSGKTLDTEPPLEESNITANDIADLV
ncbi:MAG: hypothetical protein A3I13_00210 [Gammaproteobacteria bacterium RIFCSPLOWO2_02_FULL_47_50]|nr:MAG: hypothetical protein A2993_04465 [Gammaproteobacteria bacterium RIFCSPLOWO2_01_FULL_47_190]OGT72918.1 MAG: hypothetical protein A2W76_02505 [Gammaproteobacteria bacterium RIFCSPLOWO2_12_47_11]OGT80604.1 MAG: hypothetical protein A3I13_00210 [Gammaproteobacteria bacterium RIFCSPLOWO2_02_FULL_47_50]OGT82862.1 MAG: hypothetical protein A3G42_02135 [Gammaproteobacteria bacterium RIFCSPLOWO2_12_FULL_47_76]